MKQLIKFFSTIFIIFAVQNSFADREITITEGHVEPTPVAVNFFASDVNNKNLAADIVSVISNDLKSCAFFNPVISQCRVM